MNDKCTAGSCLGTAYTCNDGKPCTSDACKGDGTCLAPIDPARLSQQVGLAQQLVADKPENAVAALRQMLGSGEAGAAA